MLERLYSATRLLTTLAADDLRCATTREHRLRLMRVSLLIAVALLVLLTLTASAAEPARTTEPVYNVELVIIRPVTPIGVPEDWTVAVKAAEIASGDEEEDAGGARADSSAGRLAVRTLSSAQYRLAGVDSAIARSRAYELLSHVGWTQAPTERGAGLAVDLGELVTSPEPLRGTASLERGRYLYLKLDLAYSPATPPNSLLGASSGSGPTTFTLRQTRRVKVFERHYFDHPAFGVVAMVSPVGGRSQ